MLEGKKVLVLCTTDNMITQFLFPHIEHMESLGAKIICACANTGTWFYEIKDKGIDVREICYKRNPFRLPNLKAYFKTKKLVKKEKIDLIYCQQPVGGMIGRLVGRKLKVPVFYTAHGFFFYKGCSLKKRLLYKNAERFLSRYTQYLVTMNEEDYGASLEMKAKEKYKISGIGLDLEKYKNIKKDENLKKSLGYEEDDFLVLTVAEMIKRKNYKTMLDAIAKLKNDKIKFVACGTGKEKDKILKYAKKLKIEKNVKFLGYRKDINQIMQISDVFFLPSRHEGLTMAIMEAMNFALPVVTSNVRGNVDLVDNEKGGYVCEIEDVQGMADKITLLYENPDIRKQMGDYNKTRVEKYSLENVKKELEKIYERI